MRRVALASAALAFCLPAQWVGGASAAVACLTAATGRRLGAKCSVTLAREGDTMGNPRFLCTRSPKGRGLAPIGTGQHQICRVRPFLSRKAIFFLVLWAPCQLDQVEGVNSQVSCVNQITLPIKKQDERLKRVAK